MNSGDTAWTLICTALVLLMTPGLAFFYGGLVRERNAINTIKMSFVALGCIALVWALVGYSLAFGPGNAWIGGLAWVGLDGVGMAPNPSYSDSIPHLVFMAFQMMFAIITPALISGAVVGRMKFKSYVAFIVAWSILIYAPLARWVWGEGGWLGEMGALDFAGGTVVHISAGVSALVAALVLGPRRARREENPHNIPFVILGASLLWFGWFGFNAGSALAADGVAALAIVTTMLSAAAAVATWLGVDAIRGRKPNAIGAAIAAVVGLVAVTPAAGFVTPMSAILIGVIATLVSYLAVQLINKTGVDDTLDVFACHGLGGISGALLTGVFASTAANPGGADGLLSGNVELIGIQAIGVGAAALYSAVGTVVILYVVKKLMGLRPTVEAEAVGIDLTEHAETAYARESVKINRQELALMSE
ncbi:MAG: ammonium transporter [Planctomycetota bacterium]|jgi:Amt family ammonium transporter